MTFGNTMFARGIIWKTIFRTDCALPGHSALQLRTYFLRVALLQGIGPCGLLQGLGGQRAVGHRVQGPTLTGLFGPG